MPFWQIGSEGGFLPASVMLNDLLIGPAERADVIMDFTGMEGQTITLLNLGPDEPFGGGIPGIDFNPADPGTTGKVMRFVVGAVDPLNPDVTTVPANLALPAITPLDPALAVNTRRISLNEEESQTVFVAEDDLGNVFYDPTSITPFGPTEALLGTMNQDGFAIGLGWAAPTTENPGAGDMEVWEIHNFTADAHPIHIHLVQFQVVNREGLLLDAEGETVQPAVLTGAVRGPETWETGFKDTVIAYPGEVTRVVAQFTYPGLYVWHCHILEHEDNEMMRPYCVGDSLACQQHNGAI